MEQDDYTSSLTTIYDLRDLKGVDVDEDDTALSFDVVGD